MVLAPPSRPPWHTWAILTSTRWNGHFCGHCSRLVFQDKHVIGHLDFAKAHHLRTERLMMDFHIHFVQLGLGFFFFFFLDQSKHHEHRATLRFWRNTSSNLQKTSTIGQLSNTTAIQNIQPKGWKNRRAILTSWSQNTIKNVWRKTKKTLKSQRLGDHHRKLVRN